MILDNEFPVDREEFGKGPARLIHMFPVANPDRRFAYTREEYREVLRMFIKNQCSLLDLPQILTYNEYLNQA